MLCVPRPIVPLVLVLCLAGSLAAVPVAAQPGEPYVFADLADGETVDTSFPHFFSAAVGGAVLFLASDPTFGRELWRSDGTRRGTFLLADLCPGTCGYINHLEEMTVRDDLAFFVTVELDGDSGLSSKRLWRTDGTAAGTRPLIRSLDPDSMGQPEWLPGAGRLLFNSATAETGLELWVSDGTEAGTRLLRDLRPGAEGSEPRRFHRRGDVLYFTANDGSHGSELWRSDGTAEGTRLVADLVPGADGSGAYVLGDVGERLLLDVFDPVRGRVLWTTDGTAAGTRFVTDPYPGAPGSYLHAESDGQRVFFISEPEGFFGEGPYHVWVSDGTAAGTRRLTQVADPLVEDRFTRDLVPLGEGRGIIFNWVTPETGREPWASDGTVEGTGPLGDFCPGDCSSRRGEDIRLDFHVHPGQGLAYFSADDGDEHGVEPWVSDGTPAGTRMLLDSCPGECSGGGALVADAGDRVLLVAGPTNDEPLLATRGTEASTMTVVDGGLTGGVSARPLPDGERFVLTLEDPEHGTEPWVTDLTPGGTRLLRDIAPGRGLGSRPRGYRVVADRLLFRTDPEELAAPPELWTSDGTPAGTRTVDGVPEFLIPGFEGFRSVHTAATDGRLFFLMPNSRERPSALLGAALDVVGGGWTELPLLEGMDRLVDLVPVEERLFVVGSAVWTSDGTVAGTRRMDVIGGRVYSRAPPAVVGDELYFDALHPTDNRMYLWRSDGSGAGTVPIRVLGDRIAVGVEAIARLGDGVVFAFDGELWRSDGTPGGTEPFLELPPEHAFVIDLVQVDERAFLLTDGRVGDRLWVTDGTANGTEPLLDISQFSWSVPLEGHLIFAVFRRGSYVLWRSDGTVEGTVPLGAADAGSFPPGFEWHRLLPRLVGDRLLLAGRRERDAHWELWLTDGTPAGTLPVGVFAEQPGEAARLGDTVFFTAFHPELGEELWAFHLDGTPPPDQGEVCTPDDHTLCLLDGRFRLRAQWRDPRSGRSGQAGARPFPGSERTGLFWFFKPDNVELIVKQLDGRSLNGFFWTFYGALTDVEYWIEVDDLESGAGRTFHNPPGEVCGRGETAAFPDFELSTLKTAAAEAGDCGEPGVLCLHDGRFRVSVEWRDQRSGDTGAGTAIPGTDRSGYFWFFREDNVELVVKVLDGRPVNGRFWVFYGALTDVEYDVRVVDTASGEEHTYHNPPGEICGDADTTAF